MKNNDNKLVYDINNMVFRNYASDKIDFGDAGEVTFREIVDTIDLIKQISEDIKLIKDKLALK